MVAGWGWSVGELEGGGVEDGWGGGGTGRRAGDGWW